MAHHASCTGKKRVGHSPTRRIYLERTRLNRGAQLLSNCVTTPSLLPGSHYTRGPSYCHPYLPRGALHGRPHGPVRVASCHASAPPAPRVGQLWLCHVASVSRRIHALSRMPRQLIAWASSPCHHLFRDLNKEKHLKIHLKIK